MSDAAESRKKTAKKESLLLLWLLLAGIFILPGAIYLIGRAMFGEYGGTGFSAFYGQLHSELRSGDYSVWFLVLSPYLVWQILRLTIGIFRWAGNPR